MARVDEPLFQADYATPDASPLSDNASMDVLIVVPAGVYPRIRPNFWCEGLAQRYVYEGATVSDNGDELDSFNRNRNSSTTPSTKVYSGPTVSDAGDALHNGDWFGGSAGAIRFEGESGEDEIVLKPSTNYLLRVTARAATLRASIEVDWSE